MANAIRNVTLVTNTRTGQTGTFIARHFNAVSEQWTVIVKVGNFKTGWNEGEAA
jgi:hypothetical protein